MTLVKTLKEAPVTKDGEADICIPAPGFDHAVKDPVQDAIKISSRTRLVIVEGNYTLLKQDPWDQIAEMCDERLVMVISIAWRVGTDTLQMVCRRACGHGS